MTSINDNDKQDNFQEITSQNLIIENMSFSYHLDRELYNNFSQSFEPGLIYSILGKSGVGKSTLFKIINGELNQNKGELIYDGNILKDSSVAHLKQDYKIFGHIKLYRQLQLAAKEGILSKAIPEILINLELESIKDSFPSSMSGGQRQRAALAITLVTGRPILLLDEPLSAVHEDLRDKIQEFLIAWVLKYKLVCLLVTHQLEEALYMGSKIIILKQEENSKPIDHIEITSSLSPEIRKERNSYYFRDELIFISRILASNHSLLSFEKEKSDIYGIIDEYSLAMLEQRINEIWIVDSNLNTEEKNNLIREVVIENLSQGKIYKYVIPLKLRSKLQEVLLDKYFLKYGRNNPKLDILILPEDHWIFGFEGIVLYNPRLSKSLGFSYLGSPNRSTLWQLPQNILSKIIFEIEKSSQKIN